MTAPTPLNNDQIVTFAPAAGSFEPIDGGTDRKDGRVETG